MMPAPETKDLALFTTGATYPGTAEHISAVRAGLRTLLGGFPRADDVVLCVSELATNAVLHSRSRMADGSFTVRGKASPGDYCLVEVEDEGGPWIPTVTDPGRGHGLTIVQALADDWGIDGDHGGRRVWARFDWGGS
jgi:anti-sigma regulatory factor (Ser/Thr protein kinase)